MTREERLAVRTCVRWLFTVGVLWGMWIYGDLHWLPALIISALVVMNEVHEIVLRALADKLEL